MPPRKADNKAERMARLEEQLERLRLNGERTVRTNDKPTPQAKADIRDTDPTAPRKKHT
jgi:hypothetical protein